MAIFHIFKNIDFKIRQTFSMLHKMLQSFPVPLFMHVHENVNSGV